MESHDHQQNNPLSIVYIFNQYYFIAQVLNLASYSQKNFLILRLLFIASSLFFVIFTLTSKPILIDILLFNLTFFIINIWRSIPLFMDLVPPKLNRELEEIYNKYFYRYMRKQEFKMLFKKASRQVYKISCSIIKPGNGFNNLFFIPHIPNNCKVFLGQYGSDYQLSPYSWVGILEFLEFISTFNNKITKYNIRNNNCFWKLKLKLEIGDIKLPSDLITTNTLESNDKRYDNDNDKIKEQDFLYDVDDDEKKSFNNTLKIISKSKSISNTDKITIINNNNTEITNNNKVIVPHNHIAKYNKGKQDLISTTKSINRSVSEIHEADEADAKLLNDILFPLSKKKKDNTTSFDYSYAKNATRKNSFDENLFLLENKNKDEDYEDQFVVVYEFDLMKLESIFNNQSCGSDIMKALYSMWLEHCSDIVKQKNEKSHEFVKTSKRTANLFNNQFSVINSKL